MPLGGMVGRVPLPQPEGFLPYPPAHPGHLQIAGVPQVPGPLVLNELLPLAKAITRLPVHGMLPGQFISWRIRL